MIFGELTLRKEIIPETFGQTRYIIEKGEEEAARLPSSIVEDFRMSGFITNREIRVELQRVLEFEIGSEHSLDIEEVVDIIMNPYS
jgi:hypothetical protein